jgi:hypothetical protein
VEPRPSGQDLNAWADQPPTLPVALRVP